MIVSASPTRNVAEEPACRFEIDPAALFTAMRTGRAGGPALIGYYHSHPGGNAEPSLVDSAMAAPDGKIWLIVAQDDVRAWRATPRGFQEVAIRPSSR